ncbi:MAG TPA: monovalent cation/H+ antiporter subunit D family protein [Mogibacterium sp.]|nr:monovalent cation/H+ antiporter subunit D family protein [Mogibacterium sp.]
MIQHYPALVVILPLCGAALSLALTKIHLHLGRNVIFLSMALSFYMSIMQLRNVVINGPMEYRFGGYAIPYSIEFRIDTVNGLVVAMVALMGLITAFYCISGEIRSEKLKVGGAYAVVALFVAGMLGNASSADAFNMYVFLEITALAAYCLIALGGNRGMVAAFRYMLVGTIAGTFYLLGVGILYSATGTLNMQDMSIIIQQGGKDEAVLVALCLMIAGLGIKSALFPFHGWQPSAHTHEERGSAALIAGVMVKIPVYMLFRFVYCVFGTNFKYMQQILIVLGIFVGIGMMYGSIRAIGQTNMKKLLAYSSITQTSYFMLGIVIGSPVALAGSLLHFIGDAFIKGGLFYCAGAIKYKFGTVNIDNFGRIYKKMPVTSALIVAGALSMIGIPPTVGFFSKWYIAMGAIQTGKYIFVILLIISSLLNAIYFFKIIEKIFMSKDKGLEDVRPVKKGELPWSMLVPMSVCIVVIFLLGFLNVKIINMVLPLLKGVGM